MPKCLLGFNPHMPPRNVTYPSLLNRDNYPHPYTASWNMPRISQRKALIEWFLGGIERHQAHLDQERFQDFLRRTMRQLQQGLDEAMNMVEPSGDDDSSVTCTVTITISESDESDSMRSLLSSEWDDDDEVDHEMEMQHKLRGLKAVLAKRYLRERGGIHRFQNVLERRY
ncbi:hypothetical protein BGX38DRAFT_1261324 [Terfezia claveryi]|nr:hypothetical protein BGX38DRAFT_1261324 [Terfezia claveryi]